MSLKPLVIDKLVAKVPIIQGGMGIGVSLANLAGAVGREGGIGILSTAQIGYKEELFEKAPMRANMNAIKTEFDKAKAIADGGLIGFNIMAATFHYDRYVKRYVEVGADVIISGAGLPINLPELVAGSKTKIAPIVSSNKAAKVLLSTWKKRYNKTADFVVIEGPDAGGHLGFKAETLSKSIEQMDEEIVKIVDTINTFGQEFNRDIPVIFAGGVFERSDIEHYISLGCSGVQMATRFVVTEECDAPEAFKKAYINAGKEDITIIKSPVGMPGRAIINQFSERIQHEQVPVKKCRSCLSLKHCDRETIPYCITETLLNAVTKNPDHALVFAGSNAYKIKEKTTVKAIFNELTTA
ncbi:NAD(P)H-dependent flavin oxidoreductase [Candidatus Enterococcus ikei]|uniref:Probable nitronate monooxygenase n=1 Tax=Candidatus Enterococcus ikei TaxID=2815326 RepID=A0ABS3H2V2_9ENTE|nr:nitronate monooxygenase family protein [Enterococcus sp. DIV0869a]MBO0441488.1 nitronate monooxygenase [Enterococcus sp. DIV0869a]